MGWGHCDPCGSTKHRHCVICPLQPLSTPSLLSVSVFTGSLKRDGRALGKRRCNYNRSQHWAEPFTCVTSFLSS